MVKKQKVKKTKQSPAAKTDKKGFRVLTDEHDLYQLFGAKKKSKQEDFGRMFEEFHQDKQLQLLLQEKKVVSNQSTPLTVSERIKTYPAPQAELDLHGNTAPEAEKRTEAFIENARRKKICTVRIIVGKGLHSILIGLSRQLFIFIPVLYVLSGMFGVEGVWFSSPVAEVLATVVTILFLIME